MSEHETTDEKRDALVDYLKDRGDWHQAFNKLADAIEDGTLAQIIGHQWSRGGLDDRITEYLTRTVDSAPPDARKPWERCGESTIPEHRSDYVQCNHSEIIGAQAPYCAAELVANRKRCVAAPDALVQCPKAAELGLLGEAEEPVADAGDSVPVCGQCAHGPSHACTFYGLGQCYRTDGRMRSKYQPLEDRRCGTCAKESAITPHCCAAGEQFQAACCGDEFSLWRPRSAPAGPRTPANCGQAVENCNPGARPYCSVSPTGLDMCEAEGSGQQPPWHCWLNGEKPAPEPPDAEPEPDAEQKGECPHYVNYPEPCVLTGVACVRVAGHAGQSSRRKCRLRWFVPEPPDAEPEPKCKLADELDEMADICAQASDHGGSASVPGHALRRMASDARALQRDLSDAMDGLGVEMNRAEAADVSLTESERYATKLAAKLAAATERLAAWEDWADENWAWVVVMSDWPVRGTIAANIRNRTNMGWLADDIAAGPPPRPDAGDDAEGGDS